MRRRGLTNPVGAALAANDAKSANAFSVINFYQQLYTWSTISRLFAFFAAKAAPTIADVSCSIPDGGETGSGLCLMQTP